MLSMLRCLNYTRKAKQGSRVLLINGMALNLSLRIITFLAVHTLDQSPGGLAARVPVGGYEYSIGKGYDAILETLDSEYMRLL